MSQVAARATDALQSLKSLPTYFEPDSFRLSQRVTVMKYDIFRFASSVAASLLVAVALPATANPIKNVVLAHGAFVGGAVWRPVYDILVKDGYNVTLVQKPLTFFPMKCPRQCVSSLVRTVLVCLSYTATGGLLLQRPATILM
jgi:hypothetical protein